MLLSSQQSKLQDKKCTHTSHWGKLA